MRKWEYFGRKYPWKWMIFRNLKTARSLRIRKRGCLKWKLTTRDTTGVSHFGCELGRYAFERSRKQLMDDDSDDDVCKIWRQVHLTIIPSYTENLKTLIKTCRKVLKAVNPACTISYVVSRETNFECYKHKWCRLSLCLNSIYSRGFDSPWLQRFCRPSNVVKNISISLTIGLRIIINSYQNDFSIKPPALPKLPKESFLVLGIPIISQMSRRAQQLEFEFWLTHWLLYPSKTGPERTSGASWTLFISCKVLRTPNKSENSIFAQKIHIFRSHWPDMTLFPLFSLPFTLERLLRHWNMHGKFRFPWSVYRVIILMQCGWLWFAEVETVASWALAYWLDKRILSTDQFLKEQAALLEKKKSRS